jgi:hypothetical protein
MAHDILVAFFASGTIEIEALATLIETEIEENLVPDQIVIVVRDPSFDVAVGLLKDASLSEATFARLGSRVTITAVSYDRSGKEARRAHIMGAEARHKVIFFDFQRRAMTHIFNVRGGFVESTSTYHFENPSGRHTQKFIRLSNILTRGAEIAFIGFCTLPHIPIGTNTAYLDTPSLYAVIAAINEQLASFPEPPPSILADNFGSYAGLAGYSFDRQHEALVLISASSSGSMASELIGDFGFDPNRVLHLLFLGSNKSSAFTVCDLGRDDLANPDGFAVLPLVEKQGECAICATGSVAVKLQGDQFDIAGPQPGSILINKADAPRGLAELMRRTAGKGMFALGLGRATGTQPRQFDVRVDALLDSPDFSKRLEYVLRRAAPASLTHVVPIDDHSVAMAVRVADHATREGHGVAIVNRSSINDLSVENPGAIAVVGAVIESGRSLLDISRDLRSVAPGVPLIYFVGLSKSSDEDRREALSRTLIQTDQPVHHEYIQIERIVLPPSHSDGAWAAELNLLVNPDFADLVPETLRDHLQHRIRRLRRQSESMLDGLFIGNAPDRELRLNPGFVFWPSVTSQAGHSQADVFFTVASVLQQLRANSDRPDKLPSIKSNWFQQTILAPGNFGRFNDDIIQASLLRAATPFELNYSNSAGDSREFGRLICRILAAADTPRGGAAAEFLLAIATGRLQLCHLDIAQILDAPSSELPTVAWLQAICRTRFGD